MRITIKGYGIDDKGNYVELKVDNNKETKVTKLYLLETIWEEKNGIYKDFGYGKEKLLNN